MLFYKRVWQQLASFQKSIIHRSCHSVPNQLRDSIDVHLGLDLFKTTTYTRTGLVMPTGSVTLLKPAQHLQLVAPIYNCIFFQIHVLMQYMNTFCSLRFKERNNVVVYVFKSISCFFSLFPYSKRQTILFKKNLLISISGQYDISDVPLHFNITCFKRFHYLH